MINNMMLTVAAGGVSGAIDRSIPFGDRMLNGVETLVLGMGTVFAVLIIIWIILEISSRVFGAAEKQKKNEKTKDKTEQTVVTSAPVKEEEKSDDGALIAAITAAVYAYIDAEKAKSGNADENVSFKVVSFRKLR